MSINIDALFQHLMKDPDIIPPEGEDKEDIAMAMATQRVKQSNNNNKALNMAKEDRSISKLLYFLKAEDDEEEIDTREFGKHERNFTKHRKVLEDGKNFPNTAAGRRNKKEYEEAKEYLDRPGVLQQAVRDHDEKMEQLQAEGSEDTEGTSGIDDAVPEASKRRGDIEDEAAVDEELGEASPETPAPKGREPFATGQAGESSQEAKARAGMSREERIADARARAAAMADMEEDEAPHHSLDSAVDAISNAAPDVELDHYGNDPDSPFHVSRFGDDPKAFHNIHSAYTKEDLAKAYDGLEKAGKQRSLNFDGKEGGSLVESTIHNMMEEYRKANPGTYESPLPQRGGGEEAGLDEAASVSDLTPEAQEAARKKRTEIQDTPASNWYEANVPDHKSGEVEWDKYFNDNNLIDADEHKINEHLHNFLKGRGKKNLTTPPKPTPTAEHVEPEVQKEIVIASQDEDDPKQEIEAKLAEHARSVIDNPDLTPHQQKVMIDSANALGKVAAKKASPPEKEITIEPPDDADTSEAILSHHADIHIEAEANGETDDEKSKAAENLHDAVISHETAGGDAEPILQEKGTRYRKLDSGQYHFQGGAKVWGDLSHRDAVGQTPEGEAEPSTDTPEAQDERQGAFDFDAPPPAEEAEPEIAVQSEAPDPRYNRQPNEKADREEWARRVRAAEEVKGAKLNATERAAVHPFNPDYVEPEAVEEPVDHLQTAKDNAAQLAKDIPSKIGRTMAGIPNEMLDRANELLSQASDASPQQQHDLIVRANTQLERIDRTLGNNPKGEHPIAAATPKRDSTPHDSEALEKAKAEMLAHIDEQGSVLKGAVKATERKRPEGTLNDSKEAINNAQTPAELHQALQTAHEDVQHVQRFYNKNITSFSDPKLATPEGGEPMAPKPEAAPKKKLTPKQQSRIRNAKAVQDQAQESLAEEQAKQEEHKKAEAEAKAKFDELQATPNLEDLSQVEQDEILTGMNESKKKGRDARKSQQTSQGHINRHQKKIDDTNAAIERATPSDEGAEQGQLIPEEEVEPTEETSEEASQAEPEPESTEGEVEPEVAIAPPDAEAGEADEEPVDQPAPARQRRPRAGQQSLGLPKPTAAERRAAQPIRSPEQASLDEAGVEAEPEDPSAPSTPRSVPRGQRDALGLIDKQTKKDFLLSNKMSSVVLSSLSDEEVDKAYADTHKKLSDKAMANNLNGVPDKEEVIQDMAEAHGRGSDEAYKEKLRKDHKYTSVQDLVKEHKAVEKEKAASKFAHEQNDAISSALNMDELSEDADKLHAMDRARDIAKKMGDSNRAVQEGGKPLLDRNAMSHLKSLLDDAVNKGDIPQDELDELANEADRMGENYLNDEHKASIDSDNDRQRAHHEEFLNHAEGMEEHELARRGHDLDHSKAHELHHYEQDEEGNLKRTGSSHSYRDEDGSVKHRDASGEGGVPGSEDDAVEGMEAGHPPKLLGLDADGKADQQEHFDLMKKGASTPLSDEEMSRFKELEAANPNLASPQYKAQLLGAQRHQLSGEGGEEKMGQMGIDAKDQEEAAGSSCRPPAGGMPPGGGKAWNPDTHRWCDKEYLDDIKGQVGPGGGSFYPEGVHAGTENAHLDHDENGVGQPMMVTSSGVHKVNMPQGGAKGMKTADGGPVSQADVLGHHLQGHAGGKVDAKTMSAMGFDHSDVHAGKGQKRGAWDPKTLTDVKGTPGAKVLGKIGGMLQRNKQRGEGKPNATGQDRQRARRGTDGSPITSVLSRIGDYTKEGLKDAAEELPGYLGGGVARDTDRYRDKQTRKAAKKVGKQQSAAQKLSDSVNRVMREDAV